MRADHVCTDCYDRNSVIPGLRHGCYRGRLRTMPVAAMIALHKGLHTWTRKVDAFIAQSEYQRDRLAAAGLPPRNLFVKPHFCATPPEVVPWSGRVDKVVHIGRLSKQKGVQVLLDAWSRLGESAPALELIGDGPDRAVYERQARVLGLDRRVQFLGLVSEERKQAALSTAKLLIMPTLWFETFGLVIAEAFAWGVPVVCSNLSCLPSIITDGRNGRLFPPGDSAALAATVRGLWERQDEMMSMANFARETHERRHRADDNIGELEEIYAAARENRARQARGYGEGEIAGQVNLRPTQ
jgi:glycosyltransferase involved in cell wall biosynthesis